MLDAVKEWLALFDFSALASDIFGRPIGALAAAILIFGSVATGLGIIIGLHYARRRSIVASRELEIKEEAIKKDAVKKELPKAEILLFGEENVDSLVYIVPFDRKTLFALPFAVGIKNPSNVQFNNLLVFARMNADIYGHEFAVRQPGPIAQAFGFERFEEAEDGTKLVVALSKLSRIPPELTYEIEDYLFTSSSTVFEGVIEANALDGKVKFGYRTEFSVRIKVTVQGENIGKSTKDFSVCFLNPPNTSIEEHFKKKFSEDTKPEKLGKTIIVSFRGREENKEFANAIIGLKRSLQLLKTNKKAALKQLKDHFGSETTDAEIMELVELGVRESLVSLTNREVVIMNRRYP